METSPNTTFGQWIKKRRKSLDLTQQELAKRVGCATITIQLLEANKRRPSKQMAGILAEQLGLAEAERPEFVRFARITPSANRLEIPDKGNHWDLWNQFLHRPTNIPTQPTPLIGRDQDVMAARKRLLDEDIRLLTLLGPPGVGKTRLAIQVATNLLDSFENGVYFIPLAMVSDPELVPAAIAQTLGVNQVGERSFASHLKEYLRDKQMLLVLDNFEQVVASAPFIAELSSTCPWLSMLITSRAPLSIRGERRFPVAPLSLPNIENLAHDPSELMCYSAIELFVERAQAVRPDFELDLENSRTIEAICTHLDGLPLAIEVVSARISFLSPQVLLEQIRGDHLLHTDGLRDVSDRHRTLHHAIDWSVALLTSEQQLLLSRLSVFNNGWTVEAAEKIMSDHPALSTMELLKMLVDNNLIVQYEHHGEPRFTLLEVIHTYTSERLAEGGEEESIRQRHAEYYLALAEEADPYLRTASQQIWLERLDVERGNFHASLTWFIDNTGDIEKGMRLAGALGWFWNLRSYVSEGRSWLTKAVQHGSGIKSAARVKVLNAAGSLAWEQGDLINAHAYLEESITLCRQLGPAQIWDLAMALGDYGNVVMYQGNQNALQWAAEKFFTLFEQLGDQWGKGLVLCLIGEVHLLKHDYTRACSCFEEASILLRKTGDKWAIGVSLMDWGYTNSLLGNLTSARTHLEESIALQREIGERFIRSMSLNVLAQVVQQQEDAQLAIALYSESLDLLRKMGVETGIADVQYNLACFVHAQGHYQLAKKLYSECLEIFSKQGNDAGVAKCMACLASGDIHKTTSYKA